MLNFRKLRQDFSSSILKEGKELHEAQKVESAKILELDGGSIKIAGRVQGAFENSYETEIEIDRDECELVDSDCDCPYNYDCQHLAALLFYLEDQMDKILVDYSKEADLDQDDSLDDEEKEAFLEKVKEAETKEMQRQEEIYQTQLLQEYVSAASILSTSPFVREDNKMEITKGDILIVFNPSARNKAEEFELQLALRLPYRSKPLHIQNPKQFLEALSYKEPLFLSGRKYFFTLESFKEEQRFLLQSIMNHASFNDDGSEKMQRILYLKDEVLGEMLAQAFYSCSKDYSKANFNYEEEDLPKLPGLFYANLETPLKFSVRPANLKFTLDYLKPPVSKILLKPSIRIEDKQIDVADAWLFECVSTGMLHNNVYYRFEKEISRSHLQSLASFSEVTIPQPLFGAFVENSLPNISRFADIENLHVLNDFITLPYVEELKAKCNLSFLNAELEAELFFNYHGNEIPAAPSKLSFDHVRSFIGKEGILARNLVEERKIMDDLFQDFIFNAETGAFQLKSEKKIVEFMTDVIPRNQQRVEFICPQNLLDQFIYDDSKFFIELVPTNKIDTYEVCLRIEGPLKGVRVDVLWDCVASRKAFIELERPKALPNRSNDSNKMPKILVFDLEKVSQLVHVFDELGIEVLEDHTIQRPLWSLACVEPLQVNNLPIEFHISEKLIEIQRQMLGQIEMTASELPKVIKADLRSYQLEGVKWLERLRKMYLNGILADDMGLGKTLQAIVAISQHLRKGQQSLIVCPTSLLYNWKEEFSKFNPKLKVLVVDGIPHQRKKTLEKLHEYDVLVTSYTLLQKDIDHYQTMRFTYVILDEAQHIKNRGTRNARSVKMIDAEHRLILSGTPIENSLEELWSLFDFLMPGFLSSYHRFVEKYVRVSGDEQSKSLDYLRRKVSPFILRRMKVDVLDDLPPVSEIVYHCQLSDVQMELYKSYAESARDELEKLVKRDGFDRVQIHVLATLTRLKQICCHPAIFAKEKAEPGDSSKYDMLLDLVQNLVDGKHKTVIFSQYTQMLQIMKEDFNQRGIKLLYLDGSSKNRLQLVKQFNEDESISVFLVSLKAGGTGLNLTGADTVIHYDMWWNPAVENQATDRVHRLGQKKSVSSYKLITLGTIEEKIAEMQKKKKGLVKKVVSCDDEVISKLTWEDVLELLKT